MLKIELLKGSPNERGHAAKASTVSRTAEKSSHGEGKT